MATGQAPPARRLPGPGLRPCSTWRAPTAEGKQKIVTGLYEKFFKLAFPRTAESLGIVYTPVEVVDFIIRAVDDVLAMDFGALSACVWYCCEHPAGPQVR